MKLQFAGWLLGFLLPVEKIPRLVLGPALIVTGLAAFAYGYTHPNPDDISPWWMLAVSALGLQLTISSIRLKRRKSEVAEAAQDEPR